MFEGKVKEINREQFDKKYNEVDKIFSDIGRLLIGYDDNKVSFEDKYNNLFLILVVLLRFQGNI